jgi:uncharacterized damage-inducible protein DinB
MARPLTSEYAAHYQQKYIDSVQGNSIEDLIINYSDKFIEAINNLPEAKADFAYADSKWTVKELLQHIIDTERVFIYRALRIARRNTYELPGFDENVFAANSHASNRTLPSLQQEFIALRKSTDIFLQTLSKEDLLQKGIASGYEITVNSIAFIIFGHTQHHLNILKERYF